MLQLTAGVQVRGEKFAVLNSTKGVARNGNDFYTLELGNRNGTVKGKIWSDSISRCRFEVGKVVEVNGVTESWQGVTDIKIDSCQIIEDEMLSDYRSLAPTMVLDIETVGMKYEDLDEAEQRYLVDNLAKDEIDRDKAKKQAGLYAIFGKVCAIGCYFPYEKWGRVWVVGDRPLKAERDDYEYTVVGDEKELLASFWGEMPKYETVVTYNGGDFDLPFLVLRSGINRVKVPLEINKRLEKFVDLQDKFRQGRAYKLEFVCKAFGVDNPKENGVSGLVVNDLFSNGDYQKIADYVARDAYSTSQLFLLWKEYMSGKIL